MEPSPVCVLGEIESWCSQRPLQEVVDVMRDARVPSGPILSMKDIVKDKQFEARNMIHRAPLLRNVGMSQQEALRDSIETEGAAESDVFVPAMMPVLSRQVIGNDSLNG